MAVPTLAAPTPAIPFPAGAREKEMETEKNRVRKKETQGHRQRAIETEKKD